MSIKSQASSLIRKVKARLNPDGQEILDPTPVAPPVGFRPAPSLSDQIREMVRSERLAREVAASGFETFEEADDFNIGDDYEPSSPWEGEFEPVSALKERAKADQASPKPSPAPAAQATEPAKPATDPVQAKPAAGDPQPGSKPV